MKDHFRPPLSELRHWESFHSRWATVIADELDDRLLPEGYFAEVQVHVGRIEVDIAAFEENEEPNVGSAIQTATATVASPQVWTLPAPTMVVPAEFPDRLEIRVFSTDSGPTLVAAIELISPRNKDRPQSQRAFAVKCASYLYHGVGLMTIDLVTNRRANLHNAMVELLGWSSDCLLDRQSLHAMSYRPITRGETDEIQIWSNVLEVGGPLPVLPLALDKGQCVPLDLEVTYVTACHRMRLPPD